MIEPVLLDVSEWMRLTEIDNYAEVRGIPREEAIRELVNKGLSYWNSGGEH